VTHAALSSLLKILQPHHPELPKDARTLLRTTLNSVMQSVGGGSYYHFGISSGIIDTIESIPLLDIHGEITFQISIDGLPLFQSSNDQFWPILGLLDKDPERKPFLIGLFYGKKKASSASGFLHHFAEDLKAIQATGMMHGGKHYTARVSAVICMPQILPL